VWSEETAVLARDHNDANVISVGGRMHTLEELTRFIDVFLHTPYSNGDRHDRRLGQIADYEKTGNLPPLPDSALTSGS
jgi:ribose 5-phosphate isomerase B